MERVKKSADNAISARTAMAAPRFVAVFCRPSTIAETPDRVHHPHRVTPGLTHPIGQGVALGSLLGSGAEDSVGDREPLGSGAEDSVADAEPLGSVDGSDVGPAVAVVGAADDPGAVPVGVGGGVRLSRGRR